MKSKTLREVLSINYCLVHNYLVAKKLENLTCYLNFALRSRLGPIVKYPVHLVGFQFETLATFHAPLRLAVIITDKRAVLFLVMRSTS